MLLKSVVAALAACTCLSAFAQTSDLREEPICDVEESELDGEHAQRAWLEYREASCQINSERPGYPEIAAAVLDDCRAFMTRERTFALRLVGRLQGRS